MRIDEAREAREAAVELAVQDMAYVAAELWDAGVAGDLVAHLEMARGMKRAEAKDYVAGRLVTSAAVLADPLVMHEVRGELRLGRVFQTETTYPDDPRPQEAKRNIAARLVLQIDGAGRSPGAAGV
jgi:dimethylamine---corrinoid protein Co-methyltransferase